MNLSLAKLPIAGLYLLLSLCIISFSSCGDDDDDGDGCNVQTISGEMIIHGNNEDLTVAVLQINSSSDFGDLYTFNLTSLADDCSKTTSLSMNLTIPEGGDINGTYPIEDFLDAGLNECSGTYTVQNLNPISVTNVNFVSGSITIAKNNNDYDIDLSALLAGGEEITMSTSYEF